MKAEVRDAREEDIAAILADIRPADVDEMAALGTTPERALRGGMAVSDWTMTGVVDGVPVCMFGVAPQSVLSGIGRPWMLAATGLEAAQVPFLRASRPVVRAMRASYPRLINLVDARNAVAMRWLRWLGFRFDIGSQWVGGHEFIGFRSGDWYA